MSGASNNAPPPLTGAEKLQVFKTATSALPKWYEDEIREPVSDERLKAMLEAVLGIFGGSGGPDRISICYQGSGLKIWACRSLVNYRQQRPVFSGNATIAAARQVYGIRAPNDTQMDMF